MQQVSTRTAEADRALAQLPRWIKVAGFDIEIVRKTAAEAHSDSRYGVFSSMTQTIEIQWGMPSVNQLVNIFFHEVSHAIFWVYGLGEDDKEERIANTIGVALTALHRDNPWLSAWVQKALTIPTKRGKATSANQPSR